MSRFTIGAGWRGANSEIAGLGPIRRLSLYGHQDYAIALRRHAGDTDRPISLFPTT
ncbi:hypothetical protein HFP71_09645 [Streptomyces sp. ARC32]